VVAPDTWMREPAPEPAAQPEPVSQPAAAPAPPRFMSQDEDSANEQAFFFSSAQPPVATTVTVSASARPEPTTAPEAAPAMVVEPLTLPDVSDERFMAQAREVEMREPEIREPGVREQPRDYAGDLVQALRNASEQQQMSESATSLFAENNSVAERDLDVPAFLRRVKF